MAVLRANEIKNFVDLPPAHISGILIYGPNEARISEITLQIIRNVTGSIDDPFNLVRLNENQLKETPGKLIEEMFALSFTGGRKVIWVKYPGNLLIRQVDVLLNEKSVENLLVIQAGSLKKSAAIRKKFEASKRTACIACYDDNISDLVTLIVDKIESRDKKIDKEATRVLIESTGNNRSLLLAELEKLLIFCGDAQEISLKDVEALSSNALHGSLDELCDFTCTGDASASISRFRHLSASGIPSSTVLNTLSNHLVQIQSFRVNIDEGQNAETVIKSARPPIFFKRQSSLKRQLVIWQSPAIKKALSVIFNAILLTRDNADLADSICERALIALSKSTQSTTH